MIVDAHLHVDDIPALGWKLEAAECVRRMDEAGIQRGVVMTIVDAPEVNPCALELIAEACVEHPGRLDAFARIHPWYGDESLALLERAFALGFKGLKLHPVTTIAHPAGEDTLRLIRAARRARRADAVPLRRRADDDALGGRPRCCGMSRGDDHPRPHGRLLPRRRGDRGRRGVRERPGGRRRAPRLRRERPAIAGRRQVIVDSLTFVGESLFGRSASADELVAGMDELEVDRAVVCPLKPRGYHLAAANETVAEAVAARPDRLVGMARVDPLLGDDAGAELERALDGLGLRGLFLHPWEETFRVSDARVDAVVEVARRRAVPVIVAAGYPWLSEGLQVGALAHRFPDVMFVATNGLQLNISGLGQTDAELALADNANLLVQTAGVYREDFIQGVVRRLGAHRVLYASAFPVLDPRLEIRRVQWAGFSAADEAALLGGNAASLFGLAPA
jgi:predicted TIM-barrel fold metal-dependent hydrolase